MARRADHSHDELSELVLSAARKIVETGSHTALTARRISTEIGYAVGTLYNHFKNIDEIILHLNARTFDLLAEELEQTPLSGNALTDTQNLVSCYLEFLTRHPELWRMIFEHSLPDKQSPPIWYIRKAEYVLSIYERALTPLFGGPCKSSHNATRTLWSGIHGITSLHVSGKLANVTSMSVSEMTDNLASSYIRGIEAETGT